MGITQAEGKISLEQAFRLGKVPRVAFTGAGGKTTALFRLARLLPQPVLVTATTHLAGYQLGWADHRYEIHTVEDVEAAARKKPSGVILLMGPDIQAGRVAGLAPDAIEQVHRWAETDRFPLLIEADGSRQKPLKAPAEHEPAIPSFVDTVVVVAGLSGLGKPLNEAWVHRPERFARLSGLRQGEEITLDAVVRVLVDPQGGLKNIPPGARRIALLNQADTQELRNGVESFSLHLPEAGKAAFFPALDSVVVAALEKSHLASAVYEPTAGIILAAGQSRRFQELEPGRPKQLLSWKGMPFVHQVAQTALKAGLQPVVVVLGAFHEQVSAALAGLPVQQVYNPDWEQGQSTSIKMGLHHLLSAAGSAIFLLVDQPQVPVELLTALQKSHAATLAPIVAPQIQGRRGNPVLFDRDTFGDLLKLEGDMGGRALFARESPYRPAWLDWDDPSLLFDVDTPEDYRRLLEQSG
ncbi:MAG: selenium cofactor biosynthesis protein YqeC [Omnitrophica WOR_2 bacterium]